LGELAHTRSKIKLIASWLMSGRWRRRPGIGVNVTFGMRGDLRGGAITGVGSTSAMTRRGKTGVMVGTLLGILFRVLLVCVRFFSFNPRLAVGFGAVIIGGAVEMRRGGGVVVTLCSPWIDGASLTGCLGKRMGVAGCRRSGASNGEMGPLMFVSGNWLCPRLGGHSPV
jgi:hypothetical protein